MILPKNLTGLAALFALGACSSTTTPEPVSVPEVGTANLDATTGSYSVTVGGQTTALGSPTSTVIGVGARNWNTADYSAYSYGDPSVTTIGGFNKTTNTPFAGISGSLGAIPASSSAIYNGRIGLTAYYPAATVKYRDYIRVLQLNVDFGAGTVSQAYNGVTIDGTISGSAFTGTATYDSSGAVAQMAGGFYGTNTVAGAFSGPEFAGAFLGTIP